MSIYLCVLCGIFFLNVRKPITSDYWSNEISKNDLYLHSLSSKTKVVLNSRKELNTSIDSIDFFPWKDDIDYKSFCWSLKKQYDQFTKPPIIHIGTHGGVGHKMGFLFNSVFLSLKVQRPLRLYMPDMFWVNTDSCMKAFIYTKEEWEKLNKKSLLTCSRKRICRGKWYQSNSPVLFDDFFLKSLPSLKYINSLNLTKKFNNTSEFKNMIYRLSLNPKKNLQDLILQQLKLYPKEFVGIQIRSGGNLSNYKERVGWITEKELPGLASFINSTIMNRNYPTTVYLCTDSNYIEEYLKHHLPNLTFLSRMSIGRSHSSGNHTDSTVLGALFDAYITAHASHLFYTKHSSYGTIVRNFIRAEATISLPLRRRFIY